MRDLGRRAFELFVGIRWFAPELFCGSTCFGGDERPALASCAATARSGQLTSTG
jgi:hypothetical protein